MITTNLISLDFIEVKTTVIFYDDEVKVLPVTYPSAEGENVILGSLPRRHHQFKLKKSQLKVKKIPQWTSCPDADTSDGIWSMAITEREAMYAAVLALSIKVLSD